MCERDAREREGDASYVRGMREREMRERERGESERDVGCVQFTTK